MKNYTFSMTAEPLNSEEKKVFNGYLSSIELDSSIWDLFEGLLQTTTRYSMPMILRMHKDGKLIAAVILIKCYDHGSTLTGFKPAIHLMKLLRMPAYVWMKSGIGAELLANPGFVNDDFEPAEILPHLIKYIQKSLFLSFILDLEENDSLYSKSAGLPYPDEGIIDMDDVLSYQNYKKMHRNVKKKINHFRNNGGIIEVVRGRLSDEYIGLVGNCVRSTSKNSVFKLPYQENYPAMCMRSASLEKNNVVHFVCKTSTDFLGYHSFMDFGSHLRCLNGAFNRELKTTHHAYENMILKVVEYSEEKGIKRIHFGPVLNETKRRMMHEFVPTNIHFSSSNALLNSVFPLVLRNSKMMNKSILRFSRNKK